MAQRLSAHKRQQHVIRLAPLELVYCAHVRRRAHNVPEDLRFAAPFRHDLAEQAALAVVRREDGDALAGVAEQPHVDVRMDKELRLCDVLVEVGHGLSFPRIHHIDQLEHPCKAGVPRRSGETRIYKQRGKCAEAAGVRPGVERRQGLPRAPLSVEDVRGDTQPHKASKHALVEAAGAAQSRTLYYGWELAVVADHDDAAVRGPQEDEGDKGLDLEDLPRLLHDYGVAAEPEGLQVPPPERSVRGCHRDDACLVREEVVDPVRTATQQLEGPQLPELAEQRLQVLPTLLKTIFPASKILTKEFSKWKFNYFIIDDVIVIINIIINVIVIKVVIIIYTIK